MNRLVIPALAMLLVTPGCATRRVAVESNPPGALVRVDGVERRAPCTLHLPRGRHEITVTLDQDHEQRVVAPRGPGLWRSSARILGKTGACILYTVSAPFIFVGTVSSAVLAGAADSGYSTDFEDDNGEITLIFLVGAAGGLGIGIPLRAAGEFLDDVSEIEAPVIYVDFAPMLENAAGTNGAVQTSFGSQH